MTTKQVQSLLTYLGYDPGSVDGVMGTKTRAAIQAFQTLEGLTVDGDAGTATEAMLIDAVTNGRVRTETAAADNSTDDSPGTFWNEIQYFKRGEFACKCGKYCDGFPAEPAEALVRTADRVRAHFNAPVTVSSGVRCTKHNEEVGGVANSRHTIGRAMDYCVAGHTAAEVLAYAQAQPEIKYAYAINSEYVHMDIGA